MDSLGLDEWEIGVNQATAPVVAILGPPFAGLVADKVGNFKVKLIYNNYELNNFRSIKATKRIF
jgi:hypothetical protein